MGYHVYRPHLQIIRHQNATAYTERQEDMTLGFRGLGKSTVGTIVRCIKYVIDDHNVRILLASDGVAAANRFLREIRSHLQYNADLIEMFGPFFDEVRGADTGRYREGFLTIKQRTDMTISEPTFYCVGIGGQSASYHFDVIVLDDLVTIRNSKTATQRKALMDWHGSTLVGCSLPHTKTHYLGTRYYPHDLYQTLEEGETGESQGPLAGAMLKIPAVIENPETGDRRSNFPERYSIARLDRMRKRMGRYHFSAQMQQDTSSGEGIIFNWADFRWYGGDEPRPATHLLDIYQFSDLTAKKTDTGAFFVNVTIGVKRDHSKVYVLDMVRERTGMKGQRDRILAQAEKWRPVQAGIEAVAMQAGFAEEITEHTILPIVGVPVEADKVFRARRVSHLFESHKVHFPMDDEPEYEIIKPLLEELTTFPDSEYMDCVDAIVGALTLAMLGGADAASPTLDQFDHDSGLLADYS